jgi:hypothetical protein
MAGVGDLVQRIGDDQTQARYSMARQSRGQMMLCVVCILQKEMRIAGFLVWPKN